MIDDPSLLGAYLDDQLDPAERRRVAAAIGDDPALTAQLPGSRPSATSVATSTARRRPAACRWRSWCGSTGGGASGGCWSAASLSAAAGVFLAVSLALPAARERLLGDGPSPPAPLAGGGRVVGPSPTVATESIGESEPGPAAELPPTTLAKADGGPPDPLRAIREQRHRALFDHEDASRIVVPVDRLDDAAIAAIEGIVRTTVRRNPLYSVVRVPGERKIAPAPTGDAVVFVLNMDEAEGGHLVDRIGRNEAVAGTISPPEPARDLMAELRRPP